ncbi:YadA C-terminal domain-containing protein [Candidatus Spongiihabitans sp.]|uniref:YadA C-terminal domain-containing protein n=1 Tax=Candidatus Spongiihabitans sp. TaxID=3101308 RepID=UPI003C7C7BD2
MARLTPPSVTPGRKMNLTIGAGFYNHETTLAISAGARVSENWTISGGIGYVTYGDDESDAGGRVAATFEF